MPLSIRSAQDEFHKKTQEIYKGLQAVTTLVDDFLDYRKTREKHDANLRDVLTRYREKVVKFNSDKLPVGLTKVPYFGHILSAGGPKLDPGKIAAFRDMRHPSDRKEIETVLGINYLAKLSPILSEITHPMR